MQAVSHFGGGFPKVQVIVHLHTLAQVIPIFPFTLSISVFRMYLSIYMSRGPAIFFLGKRNEILNSFRAYRELFFSYVFRRTE